MTKQEYENLTNTQVSMATYTNVIEPMYMATNMTKQEFVESINPATFAEPEERKESSLIIVNVKGAVTDNGEYIQSKKLYARCYDWELSTGKALISFLSKAEQQEVESKLNSLPFGCRPNIRTVDFKNCLNEKGEHLLISTDLKEQYEQATGIELEFGDWERLIEFK